MMQAPCKDCPKRYLGCHDSCPDYQAYHRANIERCKAECATKRLMSDNEICRKKEKNYFRRKFWK